jgi:hypothetical protein
MIHAITRYLHLILIIIGKAADLLGYRAKPGQRLIFEDRQ